MAIAIEHNKLALLVKLDVHCTRIMETTNRRRSREIALMKPYYLTVTIKGHHTGVTHTMITNCRYANIAYTISLANLSFVNVNNAGPLGSISIRYPYLAIPL